MIAIDCHRRPHKNNSSLRAWIENSTLFWKDLVFSDVLRVRKEKKNNKYSDLASRYIKKTSLIRHVWCGADENESLNVTGR